MEVGTEISEKIRSAIKAKLLELGSYVDDELPDYIMVMVANKKSQSQMNKDLGLFLGSSTCQFTEWLHQLLDKLHTITRAQGSKLHTTTRESSKIDSNTVDAGGKTQGNKTSGTTDRTSNKHGSDKVRSSRDKKKSRKVQSEKHAPDNTGSTDSRLAGIRPGADGDSKQVGGDSVGSCQVVDRQVIEDVRQMLVTETEDELRAELETTEEEMTQSTKLTEHQVVATSALIRPVVASQFDNTNKTSESRKRKTPTSVVASVQQKITDDDDEEYDPHNPAVGSVASIVKVTARKSSIPPLLQANRLLLLKAMTEAERSVAARKKMVVMKQLNRDSPPAEVYSPKRKRSNLSCHHQSPPPYIPSKKNSVNSCSDVSPHNEARVLTENDARHLLNRDSSRDVISRSQGNILRSVDNDTSSSVKQESAEQMRESRKIVRAVTSDKDLKGKQDRNLQITCHLSAAGSHNRKREHAPNQNLQVTVNSKSKKATDRLGKKVIDSLHAEAVNTRSAQKIMRENKVTKSKEGKSCHGRIVSDLAKEAVQRQCQAAVISVQAAEKVKTRRNSSCDRVVECDTQSVSETNSDQRNKQVTNSLTDSLSTDSLHIKDKSEDDDDLSKMIDEDLGPELLDDTNSNEFTLDLDIDEDLSHVVAVVEDDAKEAGTDEKRSGTRFIVTLDGVDDRNFDSEASNGFEQFKHPLNAAPSVISSCQHLEQSPSVVSSSQHMYQQFPLESAPTVEYSHNVYLDMQAAQIRALAQTSLQQLPSTLSKLTPPKIQPFSISLKDSDDEHEDKEAKADFYQESEQEGSSLKRTRMSERCKFWPACASGVSCEYHHPSFHCKTFPNCKFGDKCLFIHPSCRFDSKCARPDCPFTHMSRRPGLVSSTHVIALAPTHVGYSGTQTVCHYFPNCHNINCRFLHPKPCKFGLLCKSLSCPFFHPPVPGKDKLKWQASGSQSKADILSVSSSAKSESTVDKLSPTSSSNTATVSSTSQ